MNCQELGDVCEPGGAREIGEMSYVEIARKDSRRASTWDTAHLPSFLSLSNWGRKGEVKWLPGSWFAWNP